MNFKTFLTEAPEFNDNIKAPQECAEFLQDLIFLNADLIKYLKNPALRRFLIKVDNENRMETPTYKSIEKALKSAIDVGETLEFIEADINALVE